MKSYWHWCWQQIDSKSIFLLPNYNAVLCSAHCKQQELSFRTTLSDKNLASDYTDHQLALMVKIQRTM